MSEPYLVAHKVRGEPAFDIAIQMACPLCAAEGCFECDEVGYWWIIPTSGHRAYPRFNKISGYAAIPLSNLREDDTEWLVTNGWIDWVDKVMPIDAVPDHYPTASTPSRTHDIAAILGLGPKPAARIRRR